MDANIQIFPYKAEHAGETGKEVLEFFPGLIKKVWQNKGEFIHADSKWSTSVGWLGLGAAKGRENGDKKRAAMLRLTG